MQTQCRQTDSDSEPELPLNQGNGDKVEELDELAHIYEKCDNPRTWPN